MYLCTHAQRGGKEKEEEREEMSAFLTSTVHSRSAKAPFMNHSAKCFNMSTYLIVFILVWDLESVHSSDHGLHGCEDVLIHQFGKAPLVFIRVS